MQLSQTASMRTEMRQLLTPRMIQSMEILQLPLMALEERIEQELSANPVLELRESDPDAPVSADEAIAEARADRSDDERALVVNETGGQADDFARLEKIADYLENEEFSAGSMPNYRAAGQYDGERDKKMDAMANTAARSGTLADHLLNQWAFVEAPEPIRTAGELLINSLAPDGYFRSTFEQVRLDFPQAAAGEALSDDVLTEALKRVQSLDPPGIAARNLEECLLLQLAALEEDEELAEGHDFDLERALIRDHMQDLKLNRYPQISRKLGRPITELQSAVKRLARLHPFPGKQIGGDDAPTITPDAVVYWDEDTETYQINMAYDPAANLQISALYKKLMKDRGQDKKTREFLANNVRNARWLLESIEQRKSTIQRVIRQVVDAQREFLDKGPEHLKPLPMIEVADRLGIHVATVSRAVSEKWIQTPQGIFPLRRFFSGGTTSADGEDMSWDAVKEKLKIIIDAEDKKNPLNDDEIVEKLQADGITLARRTVAKYRKILNIPTARQRRAF